MGGRGRWADTSSLWEHMFGLSQLTGSVGEVLPFPESLLSQSSRKDLEPERMRSSHCPPSAGGGVSGLVLPPLAAPSWPPPPDFSWSSWAAGKSSSQFPNFNQLGANGQRLLSEKSRKAFGFIARRVCSISWVCFMLFSLSFKALCLKRRTPPMAVFCLTFKWGFYSLQKTLA